MKVLNTLLVLIAFGSLALEGPAADAQVVVSKTEEVVVSPPPPIVVDEQVVIKERRRLFRPRERVYIVKPRSKRISVPATTTVVGPPSIRRSTVVEGPAPIVSSPSTIIESPAVDIDPPAKPGSPPSPDLDLDLEKSRSEGEVRYLKPAEATAPRPATVIRSTPRG